MEDGSFLQQLHSLKDHVNALTMQYSPRQSYVALAAPRSPPASSKDPFTAQLQDVKAHLDNMRTSLVKYEANMRQQPQSSSPDAADDEMMTQSRMTLPSGPAFWQLFNSLRSDFQTLDTRVAGLEQDVDALEDRVDSLEPDKFTPAASTASQEDAGGVQLSQARPEEDLLDASMACLPELCSEDKGLSNPPQAEQDKQHHARLQSLQSPRVDPFEWQWPVHNHWHEKNFAPPISAPMVQNHMSHRPTITTHDGVAFRDREIDRIEALAAAKDTTMSDMQAQIDTLEAENQRMQVQMLRDAQARKGQESLVHHLRREMEENKETFRTCVNERQKRVDDHLLAISDRDVAIRYWQQRCDEETSTLHEVIAERDRALRAWEESHHAVSSDLREERARTASLNSRFNDHRSAKREELEQAHDSYERKIENLKGFCEVKDAIIVKQERVMSKGGRLLEERDGEIERLQRRLRASEDDLDHQERQQKRMARLLDETKSELESLRDLNETKADELVKEPDQDVEHESTMAASTEAVDGREPARHWVDYPRSTRHAADHHHERRHESADASEASAKESTHSRSPRRRRPRRHESSRHLHHRGEDRHQRHERRPAPPERPHRLHDREDRSERFVVDRHEAQLDGSDRRRARFLDESISFESPPLPAPVAARKMASEADLRSPHNAMARGAGAGRSLSKHQSMQELPGARRRLQAYVESEEEKDDPGQQRPV